MEIRRIDQTDRKDINTFIHRHWFAMEMVVHGESIDLGNADGWYVYENGEIIGLLTYRITGNEMEILSLDSLKENNGIGSMLLAEAVREAKDLSCSRIMLITTNDNLHAVRFYQKRGVDMVMLYRNALDVSRKLKPQIPLIGMDGIPLRHELELEMRL